MSITPEENLQQLIQIEIKAALGAAAAANAMAEYVADRIKNDTLRRRKSSPGTYYKAKRGEPPSSQSGKLADSVYSTRVSGSGTRASAHAGSKDPRARLFEFGGCVLQPTDKPMLFWRDSGGWWSHHALRVDTEHPFVGPTTEDAIDDGDLRMVAIDTFREYDP